MPAAKSKRPNKRASAETRVAAPAVEFTPELFTEICAQIAEGRSLRSIAEQEGMPSVTSVMRWLADERAPELREQYARAREAQADRMAEEILSIADTPQLGVKTKTNAEGEVETTEGDMIEHRRLQVDARKWLAARLAPKKYGDKLGIGGADDLPPMKARIVQVPLKDVS